MAERIFGRYEVLEEVGRGAMGVVYRARDPVIGRVVAIKTILPASLEALGIGVEEYLARFHREAEVVGRLNHRNVVAIYDLGAEHLVMEFVEGESLDAFLAAEQPPRARLVAILADIASALDQAHALGIVHRDIKPANVRVRPDGVVKVMDFGLARVDTSKLTREGAVLGSAAYMAPEVILGKPATPRSDIFSLAVLAYEALTGERPFTGKSISAIVAKIVREPHRPARELPERCEAVFARALAKDAEERYPTATAFVEALKAGCCGAEIEELIGVDAEELAPTLPGAPAFDGDELPPTLTGAPTLVPGAGSPQTEATLVASERTLAAASEQTLAGAGAPLAGADAASGGAAAAASAEPLAREASPPAPGSARPPRPLPWPLLGGGLLVVALVAVLLLWRGSGRGAGGEEPGPGVEAGPATPQGSPGATLPPLFAEGEAVTAESTASLAATAPASATPRPTPRPSSQRRSGTTAATPTPEIAAPAVTPVPRGALVELADDVTPPVRVKSGGARLPNGGRGFRLPASVLLEFVVSEDGEVLEPRILESAGEGIDAACLEAVRAWRYEPAQKDGVAVRVKQQARFTFRDR